MRLNTVYILRYKFRSYCEYDAMNIKSDIIHYMSEITYML